VSGVADRLTVDCNEHDNSLIFLGHEASHLSGSDHISLLTAIPLAVCMGTTDYTAIQMLLVIKRVNKRHAFSWLFAPPCHRTSLHVDRKRRLITDFRGAEIAFCIIDTAVAYVFSTA